MPVRLLAVRCLTPKDGSSTLAFQRPHFPRLDTLDRYVLKRYVSIYAANLVSFTLVFVWIDATNQIEDFAKRTSGIGLNTIVVKSFGPLAVDENGLQIRMEPIQLPSAKGDCFLLAVEVAPARKTELFTQKVVVKEEPTTP